MSNKSNTNIERIIAKIDNDFNPDNSDWIPRIGAWCIDAMSMLNVTPKEKKKIKVPVHEFAMMMTIALRFIPTLIEETDKIMSAQAARGADFTSGSLVSRAKALVPVLIPLFVSAFNRAGDLATAMECRCYHGGEGRTRMTVRKLRFADIIPLFLILLFGAGLVALNILKIGYTM